MENFLQISNSYLNFWPKTKKIFKRIARRGILINVQRVIYQWIRLDELYKIMESFFQIFGIIFRIKLQFFKIIVGIGRGEGICADQHAFLLHFLLLTNCFFRLLLMVYYEFFLYYEFFFFVLWIFFCVIFFLYIYIYIFFFYYYEIFFLMNFFFFFFSELRRQTRCLRVCVDSLPFLLPRQAHKSQQGQRRACEGTWWPLRLLPARWVHNSVATFLFSYYFL